MSLMFWNFMVYSLVWVFFRSLSIGLFKSWKSCFLVLGYSLNFFFNSSIPYFLFSISGSFIIQILAVIHWVLYIFWSILSYFSFLCLFALLCRHFLWFTTFSSILCLISKSPFSFINVLFVRIFLCLYPVLILWMQYFVFLCWYKL